MTQSDEMGQWVEHEHGRLDMGTAEHILRDSIFPSYISLCLTRQGSVEITTSGIHIIATER